MTQTTLTIPEGLVWAGISLMLQSPLIALWVLAPPSDSAWCLLVGLYSALIGVPVGITCAAVAVFQLD